MSRCILRVYVCNFNRYCLTTVLRSCTNMHFPSKVSKCWLPTRFTRQILQCPRLLSEFWIFDNMIDEKWNFSVVLIFTSLMSDTEHLFICLRDIYSPFIWTNWSHPPPHFFWVHLSLINFRSFLCFRKIINFSGKWIANIFPNLLFDFVRFDFCIFSPTFVRKKFKLEGKVERMLQ